MASIKELKTFLAMYEEKSFTKAATSTYQSQSSVSKQVKKLESELGVTLVERSDRDVNLTEFGELFVQHATTIVAHYKRLQDTIHEMQQLKAGRLDIGASTLPGEYILPTLIGKFKKQHPGIQVSMNICKTDQVFELLRSRTVTIAFVGAHKADEDILLESFANDELVFVGPPDVVHNHETSIKDVLEKLITRERGSGTRKVVSNYLHKQGIDIPANNMEMGSNRAILSAVANGVGYSYLSEWVIEDALKLKQVQKIKVIEGNIKRKIYLATMKNYYMNPVSSAFMEMLTQTNAGGSDG